MWVLRARCELNKPARALELKGQGADVVADFAQDVSAEEMPVLEEAPRPVQHVEFPPHAAPVRSPSTRSLSQRLSQGPRCRALRKTLADTSPQAKPRAGRTSPTRGCASPSRAGGRKLQTFPATSPLAPPDRAPGSHTSPVVASPPVSRSRDLRGASGGDVSESITQPPAHVSCQAVFAVPTPSRASPSHSPQVGATRRSSSLFFSPTRSFASSSADTKQAASLATTTVPSDASEGCSAPLSEVGSTVQASPASSCRVAGSLAGSTVGRWTTTASGQHNVSAQTGAHRSLATSTRWGPQHGNDRWLRMIETDCQSFRRMPSAVKAEKEVAIAAVSLDGALLKHAAASLRADREVVRAALTGHWSALRHANTMLRNDEEVVKERWSRQVVTDGLALERSTLAIQADREVVLIAVSQKGSALQFASEALKADKEVVWAAVAQHGPALRFADASLRDDEEVVLTALQNSEQALPFASERLRQEPAVLEAARLSERSRWLRMVETDGLALQRAPENLRGDKDVVLAAVTRHGLAVHFASGCLREDDEVAEESSKYWLREVTACGLKLEHAPIEIRDSKEAVFAAIAQNSRALQFASDSLRSDHPFMTALVAKHGWALEHAPEELRGNKVFMMSAVALHGWTLEYASVALRHDKDVALAAVSQDGRALAHVAEALRGDRDVVLAAVSRFGMMLHLASSELRGSNDIVLAAVNQEPRALTHASVELRGDADVVMEAVSRLGYVLQLAAENLRSNSDVVLAAVAQDPHALQFASDSLKMSKEFILAAVALHADAFQYAAATLKLSKGFVLAVVAIQGLALQHASVNLRGDKHVVAEAVRSNPAALRFARQALRRNEDILRLAAAACN